MREEYEYEDYKELFVDKFMSMSACEREWATDEFYAWDNDGNGNIDSYDDPEGEALDCFQASMQAMS